MFLFRDAPLDILEGGCLEFLWAANFFFYLRKKTIFFCAERPTNFFKCFVEELKYFFFVACLPFYVRYHLLFFFSATNSPSILTTNFSSLPTLSTNFCGDKHFFLFFLTSDVMY